MEEYICYIMLYCKVYYNLSKRRRILENRTIATQVVIAKVIHHQMSLVFGLKSFIAVQNKDGTRVVRVPLYTGKSLVAIVEEKTPFVAE